MMRNTLAVGFALAALVAAPASAEELEVTVAGLLADSATYSAPTVPAVTVRGELVGDYGRRSDGTVWTQLNGDSYAEAPILEGGALTGSNLGVGIRIPDELWPSDVIEEPGGYRHRGPVVVVSGPWHHHDPSRGGESWLEVVELRVERHEQPLREKVHWAALIAGIMLVSVAGGLELMRRSGLRVR